MATAGMMLGMKNNRAQDAFEAQSFAGEDRGEQQGCDHLDRYGRDEVIERPDETIDSPPVIKECDVVLQANELDLIRLQHMEIGEGVPQSCQDRKGFQQEKAEDPGQDQHKPHPGRIFTQGKLFYAFDSTLTGCAPYHNDSHPVPLGQPLAGV